MAPSRRRYQGNSDVKGEENESVERGLGEEEAARRMWEERKQAIKQLTRAGNQGVSGKPVFYSHRRKPPGASLVG